VRQLSPEMISKIWLSEVSVSQGQTLDENCEGGGKEPAGRPRMPITDGDASVHSSVHTRY
jgi:hypothetical protein